MKRLQFLFPLLSLVLLSSCAVQTATIYVPAQQSVEIDYPNYNTFRATLTNKSAEGINVAVRSKNDDQQVRGFGLANKGKADVLVEALNKLVLQNDSDTPIYLNLKIDEATPLVPAADKTYISFTLANTSAVSIPLIIPSVMNPNLSPNSKSGVDLEIGQKILFKENGKRYLLLQVDTSIENGAVIDVPVLLKKRRQELGI